MGFLHEKPSHKILGNGVGTCGNDSYFRCPETAVRVLANETYCVAPILKREDAQIHLKQCLSEKESGARETIIELFYCILLTGFAIAGRYVSCFPLFGQGVGKGGSVL